MKHLITFLLIFISTYCFAQKVKTGVEIQKELYTELYSKVGKTIKLPLYEEKNGKLKQVKESITLKVDSLDYWYYDENNITWYKTQTTNENLNGHLYKAYFHNSKPIRKFIKKLVRKNTIFKYDRNNLNIYFNAQLNNNEKKCVAILNKNTVTIVKIKRN